MFKFSNLGYTIFFISTLLLLFFSSCATTTLDRGPEWIRVTPDTGAGELYAIGGPAPALLEAKNLAYKEFSQLINSTVNAVTSNYQSITSDDLGMAVEEQFSQSITAETESVVIGVHFPERWQDPKTLEWWVLARVTEEDLETGIRKTAEFLVEKKRILEEASIDLQELGEQYLAQMQTAAVDESLDLLSRMQQIVLGTGYPDDVTAVIGESRVHAESFITSNFNDLLGSISLEVVLSDSILYRGSENVINLVAETAIEGNKTGALLWNVSSGNTVLSTVRTTNGSASCMFPIELLPAGNHDFVVSLDYEGMGISFPEGVDPTKVPIAERRILVSAGLLEFELIIPEDFPYPAAEKMLGDLFSDNLPYTFSDTGEASYSLTVNLLVEPGTANDYGLIFSHIGLSSTVMKNDKKVLEEVIPLQKGGGLDENQAARKATDQLIALIASDAAFFQNIMDAIE